MTGKHLKSVPSLQLMRGGASLVVSFLFGYTQVHPVCFRIIIKALSESNIQTSVPGVMPDVDSTLDFIEGGELPNSFLLHGTLCLLMQAINGPGLPLWLSW